VLVEGDRFLLQARLKEALAHLLHHFFDVVGLQARELDPLAEEAWSHLYTASKIQTVVLCAAVNREQELAHAHLIAASILEDSDDDHEDHQVCHDDQHRSPIVARLQHSHKHGKEQAEGTEGEQNDLYFFIASSESATVVRNKF